MAAAAGGGEQTMQYNSQGSNYNMRYNSNNNYQNRNSSSALLHQNEYKSVHYFFDLYSKGFDNLYREPKDGMISLKKNAQT
jgi:hypothetical protein